MLYLDYSRNSGQWIPNKYGGNENLEATAFIKRFNEIVHGRHPGLLTLAQESTAWPVVSSPTYLGGLGFSMKWNMEWMNDILRYFTDDPVFRKYHQNNLTFALLYAFTENFILVLSHDEVVYGKRSFDKMPGTSGRNCQPPAPLFRHVRPARQEVLFMGGDIGQWWEWNWNASLDWHLLEYEPHRKLQAFVKDLNGLYRTEPSMHEVDFNSRGFEWIDFSDYERHRLLCQEGQKPRRLSRLRLQPHPRAEIPLSRGCAEMGLLPGDNEQRLRTLLEQQHGQPGGPPHRARPQARTPLLPEPRSSAPWRALCSSPADTRLSRVIFNAALPCLFLQEGRLIRQDLVSSHETHFPSPKP